MSMLFSQPKIPNIVAQPPTPPTNTPLAAEASQIGRAQGLLAALYGFKKPSGPSKSATIQGNRGNKTLTGQ